MATPLCPGCKNPLTRVDSKRMTVGGQYVLIVMCPFCFLALGVTNAAK